MKALTMVMVMVAMMVVANAAKITWGPDGKPHIEKSDKPIKGCNMPDPFADNNTTKKPCK